MATRRSKRMRESSESDNDYLETQFFEDITEILTALQLMKEKAQKHGQEKNGTLISSAIDVIMTALQQIKEKVQQDCQKKNEETLSRMGLMDRKRSSESKSKYQKITMAVANHDFDFDSEYCTLLQIRDKAQENTENNNQVFRKEVENLSELFKQQVGIYDPAEGIYYPAEWDWSKYGVVPEDIVDQGETYLCWVPAVTACLHSKLRIMSHRTGQRVVNFSAQEIGDCLYETKKYHHLKYTVRVDRVGSRSGFPWWAADYIKTYGVSTEDNWPWVGYNQPHRLRHQSSEIGSTVTDGVVLDNENSQAEPLIIQYLSTWGPVVGSLIVNSNAFHQLKAGEVYIDPQMSGADITFHCVMIYAYGTCEGIDFYRVKNSWGSDWSDQGHGLIRRSEFCQFTIPGTPIFPSNTEMDIEFL